MRSMAGFSPSIQGNFYLSQAKTLPPQSLEQAVWLFVDKWLAWFDSYASGGDDGGGDDEGGHVKRGRGGPSRSRRPGFSTSTKAAAYHPPLRFSDYETRVPRPPDLDRSCFRRDDYQAFAKGVELALLDVEEPEEVQIRKTLPAIAERLSVLHQSLARDINEWGVQTKERLDNIESRLGDLFEGRVSMTLSSTRRVAAPAGCSTPASMTTVTPFHCLPTSPPNPASRSPYPTAAPAAAPGDDEPHFPPSPPPPPPSSYVLSRTISTVPQLWREWTVGDGPSVQGLEDLYGPRWRQAHSEQVMYGRRKMIIDEIRRGQAEGINTGAAVEEVELIR